LRTAPPLLLLKLTTTFSALSIVVVVSDSVAWTCRVPAVSELCEEESDDADE
jgi:hypothetical protein